MTMITPSYLGETIEYSSLHACRSTLEDPTKVRLSVHRIECLFLLSLEHEPIHDCHRDSCREISPPDVHGWAVPAIAV